MKPATPSANNGAFLSSKIDFRTGIVSKYIPPQKSIFEFALRARKITILGALATQFHEMSGLGRLSEGWFEKDGIRPAEAE
jgi:hypothetical protein